VNFAGVNGNIATDVRTVTGWRLIVNLKADPYEKMPFESPMYFRWDGDNMWLFVPVQQKVKEFLMTIPQFPFPEGSSLNAAGTNYQALKAAQALKRVQEIESFSMPNN
jgi:arylsulfatase